MANLVGQGPVAIHSDTSVVDTEQKVPLGIRARDTEGNEYEYVQGVASCVAGSWVTIGAARAIALLASGASGRVGVAMAAITANEFGWVQIFGMNEIALASSNGSITSGGGQLQVGGSGLVAAQGTSTGAAAGDYIFGAFAYSGQPATSGSNPDVITVFLNYPFLAQAAAVASS